MRSPFKKIGVVGKYDSPNLSRSLEKLVAFLQARRLEVVLDNRSASALPGGVAPAVSMDELGAHADVVVVLGGDGTLLSVARALASRDVPLIGINLGRLGFLTDIPADSMETMLGEVLEGHYHAEDRTLLHAEVERHGEVVTSTVALNDVVVSKGARGSMIEFEVYVDRQFVFHLRSDGLIIATPTGSTAYALSSGGPILHPTLRAFTLVPISPHTLSNRPIAISDESTIEVILVRGVGANANFDVQDSFELEEDDRVVMTTSDLRIRLLHPLGHNYFAMLREKLHWSAKL